MKVPPSRRRGRLVVLCILLLAYGAAWLLILTMIGNCTT